MRRAELLTLFLGPVLCLLVAWGPFLDGLAPEGKAALGVLALCICWWLGTPVALPVTSLAGLALLPLLGALPVDEALSLFGNPAVFFVMGVFIIAAVMLRTGLSTRITLVALRRLGASEDRMCLGVLVLSWGLCFAMVSHAVAAIMLPIVLEIIRALDLRPTSRTARRLLLGMAWGTVCGSNLTLLSSARASLGLELYDAYITGTGGTEKAVGFLDFTLGAAPVSLFSMLASALVLRLVFPPEGLQIAPAIDRLDQKVRELGPISKREILVALGVFLMIVAMIAAGPKWLGIVALLSSALLFALQVLKWEDAERYVNWGVILMYGGAIAIGGALYRTGATAWLAHSLLPAGMGPWGTLAIVSALSSIFTEIVSNSAVMAVVLPVALPLADQVHLTPRAFAFVVPITAGLAFVLPTSTPAMAMVFGTGYLRVRHTLPGLVVTVSSLCALLLLARFLWPLLGLAVTVGSP